MTQRTMEQAIDTALILKQARAAGENVPLSDARKALKKSPLFAALTRPFEPEIMNLVWRLVELAEIPFAGRDRRVRAWLRELIRRTATPSGFSLSGDSKDLLACYNGILLTVLLKLRDAEADEYRSEIDAALAWILEYQNVERGRECGWSGPAIQKYGGCMKSTPCYVGVVKSMVGLSDILACRVGSGRHTTAAKKKLSAGLEYILDHQVFRRQADGRPITSYILTFTFPFSYRINIIEILRLLAANNLLDDPRCVGARDRLRAARRVDGYWRNHSDTIHRNPAWVRFDPSRAPGLWISSVIAPLVD